MSLAPRPEQTPPPGLSLLPGGRTVALLDPDPAAIDLEQIGRSLGRLRRYAGGCEWTVAQHSILVSRLVREERADCALLHDAHEALTGDVPRPMLDAVSSIAPEAAGAWHRIQVSVQRGIVRALERDGYLERLNLCPICAEGRTCEPVQRADREAARLEMYALMRGPRPDDVRLLGTLSQLRADGAAASGHDWIREVLR